MKVRCPKCFQVYELPPVTVEAVIVHLSTRHGIEADATYVKALQEGV